MEFVGASPPCYWIDVKNRWKLHWALIFWAIVIVYQLTPAAGADDDCRLVPSPTIIYQAEHELHQSWTVDDSAVFWSRKSPAAAAYSGFHDEIRKRVPDLDPYSILQRQYQDFIRSGNPVFLAEAEKIKVVLAKLAENIRSINCLEALLLTIQLERQSMIDQPSEFGAFILKNADPAHPQIKIYYSTWDRPGGKMDKRVMSLVDADLSGGWILWRHLHNHNFFFHSTVSVMGGTCPSKADVKLYLNLREDHGLRSASITNGFDTIDLSPEDFRKLDL